MDRSRASMSVFWSLAILFWAWRRCGAQMTRIDAIPKGFSASELNWVDRSGTFLQSISGNFILGFVPSGSNFYLCVRFQRGFQQQQQQVIVWTANRNAPVQRNDNLVFGTDGNLQLFLGTTAVFTTNTAGSDAQTLQLMDTGNLVLRDSTNKTLLWQSFDHPTDTLLPGQRFLPGMRLVGNSRSQPFREGRHSLELDPDSLKLVVNLGGPQSAVTYWTMRNDSRVVGIVTKPLAYATIDLRQLSVFSNDSSTNPEQLLLLGSNGSNETMRWLVLGSDGNIQSYFYVNNIQSLDFTLISDPCQLPYTCGSYGVCSNGQCSCSGPLRFANSSDATKGCSVPQANVCNTSNPTDVTFLDLDPNLSYFANPYSNSVTATNLDECKNLCRRNCSCSGGFFHDSSNACFLYQTQKLGNFELDNAGYSTFIKVPKGGGSSSRVVIYAIVGCSLALILVAIGAFGWWYRRRWAAARLDEEDGFLEAIPGLPTRFTYRQLHVATAGFSKKLGGGGFGSVYEGTLPDKSKVAVKQLESIGQGKKEFRAEVATIGSIHHVNLVRLRGFCSEGNHRLLVYEFLPRGSLDRSLFNENKNTDQSTFLSWETRYNVAIGTVRGLAYLHDDCRERIIHCDIKPENILLDEHYMAKVSDFGLAKLVNKEQSHVFTTMRGTRGYLAPEWLLNTAISEKSDVYSFGMVLLELVSGRKNFDPNETSEKWYIPAYAFKQAEVGKLADLLDSRLVGQAEEKQVVNAVRIALWCIQEDAHLRPSTGRVLQMLEGNVMVDDPPLSSQFAVRLHDRMVDAVSERDRYSVDRYSDYNSEDLLSATYLSGPR